MIQVAGDTHGSNVVRDERERETPLCALGLREFESDNKVGDRYAKTISRRPGRNKMCCSFHTRASGPQMNILERRGRQHAVNGRALVATALHRELTKSREGY